MSERICCEKGCSKLGQHLGRYYKDGTPKRRARCAQHHSLIYGLGGWDYKKYRKTYCENRDSRLGFRCTTTIIDPEWQLDADHINGDHDSHKYLGSRAIQTLCKCCHAYKTKIEQDWLDKSAA